MNKCVKPVLPRALNVYFVVFGSDLVYTKEFPDQDRLPDETGHIVMRPADSGSPLWIKDVDGKNYVIALNSWGVLDPSWRPGILIDKAHGYFGNNPNHNCRNSVTKITNEMIYWFHDRDNELDYE